MATTRLGWDVFTTSSNSRLTNFPWITGRVRAGDAYTVLNELARRFNSEVESITRAHSWGWAYRAVRGATVISEHAAGTAVDFNAPKHPLGRSGTFTTAQVRAINRILSDLDGAVRWGGHYSGRKDEMHFELQGGVRKLAAVAKKIKGGSSSSSSSGGGTSSGGAKYSSRRTNRNNVPVYANRGANKRRVGTASKKGYRLNVVKTEGSWTQVRWNYDGGYKNAWVATAHLEGSTSSSSSSSSSGGKTWPAVALPVTDKHTTASHNAWVYLMRHAVNRTDRNLTINIQRWLRDLGYYRGIVDGKFESLTTRALQSFLKAKNLYRGAIDGRREAMTIRAEIAYLNDQRQYF